MLKTEKVKKGHRVGNERRSKKEKNGRRTKGEGKRAKGNGGKGGGKECREDGKGAKTVGKGNQEDEEKKVEENDW